MRILITGSNGLLGQKIVGQLMKKGIDFLATSSGENRNSSLSESAYRSMNITDLSNILEVVDNYHPDAIINTAAMTNVDACEEDEYKCRLINVDGVNNLLNVCEEENIHLIHLSTDFVFDGENGPYFEGDERNPLSIYATSKRDSEDLLLNSSYDNWSILRTIIVFGQGENLSRSNMVLWAKGALKSGQELTIVNDQFRAPTWADDLAWACIQTSMGNHKGIFHISGPETMSIYDLVVRIAKFYSLDHGCVKAISSDTLNQKARRPPRTGFVLDKAAKTLGYKPMTLEESLKLLENEQG